MKRALKFAVAYIFAGTVGAFIASLATVAAYNALGWEYDVHLVAYGWQFYLSGIVGGWYLFGDSA